MKILITGASGFIGQNFIKKYSSLFEIRALGRNMKSVSSSENVEMFYYDGTIASIKQALINVDAVLHLATCYIATHQEDDIDKLLSANITFGTHLLEAMKQTDITRLVNIGTTWQKFNGEDYRYANLYAATKQAFQEIVGYYTDAYKWSCVNLHLNDTYGTGDYRKKIIQLLIETANSGSSLDMSPGEQLFEACHVDDTVIAINIALKRVLESPIPSFEEFSVLTGESLTLKELVQVIESVSGKKINIKWGARAYREREVMFLPTDNYEILPGWEKNVSLESGIKEFLIRNN